MRFSAQAAKSANTMPAKIKINRIEIWGVGTSGTLTVASDGTASWEPAAYNSAAATYVYTIDNGLLSGEYVPEKVNDNDELYKNIMAAICGDLMFVPQSTDEMFISVSLTIERQDNSTKEEKNYFVPLTSVAWEPGGYVHYRMTVSRDVINVSAHLNPWINLDGPTIGFE